MGKNNISFLTPTTKLSTQKIVLERKYSQHLILEDDSTLSYASDAGYKDTQQDSMAIYQKGQYLLLLVADGMGGLEHGEIASYNIAKTIHTWFSITSTQELKILSTSCLKEEILKLICSSTMPYKSGTTLNMSIISPEKTLIVNIGDSRTYTMKDGEIKLITKDDSKAFEIFNPQTKEERDKLRFYNHNHILNNAILSRRIPKITVIKINNEEYDTICHVTDGVTDILSESELEELCQSPNPALTLVGNSIYRPEIEGNYHMEDECYRQYLHPGKDNSTAIVYTKKRTKNN